MLVLEEVSDVGTDEVDTKLSVFEALEGEQGAHL